MLRTFRGEFAQKIDNKGRVSIPAKFRRVLESCDPECEPGADRDANLIIVYGDENRDFLEGYSVEAMTKVDEKIRAMKNGPRKRYMTRFFSTLTWETSVDQTGRLVLPKKLRDKIGLTDASEAIFAGAPARPSRSGIPTIMIRSRARKTPPPLKGWSPAPIRPRCSTWRIKRHGRGNPDL